MIVSFSGPCYIGLKGNIYIIIISNKNKYAIVTKNLSILGATHHGHRIFTGYDFFWTSCSHLSRVSNDGHHILVEFIPSTSRIDGTQGLEVIFVRPEVLYQHEGGSFFLDHEVNCQQLL